MKERENKKSGLEVDEKEYQEKKESMTSFFLDKNYSPMTFKQIVCLLDVKKEKQELLKEILQDLQEENLILEDESKRYVPFQKSKLVKCVYEAKGEKFGFGRVQKGEDIFILSVDSMGAYTGDEILVKIINSQNLEGKRKEGCVVKILKRNTDRIIGKFVKSRNFGFVEPLDNKSSHLYIPKKYAENIPDGTLVQAKILKYATKTAKAEGRIVGIIGSVRETQTYIKALYQSYGLEQETFSPLVEEELKKIPDCVQEKDRIGRKDRTKEKVFTIDSEDAMDLDDGVFVNKNLDGTYTLSVYIADVSYYVKNGSAIDMEASTRGTSIYIPGTVIPMLPKKLSNGICSLNAGVDRLVLGIDMIIDSNGNVVSEDIFKAVINVKKKMSYEKVYQVMTGKEEGLEDYLEYKDDLFVMKELAMLLKEKRKKMGSIDFDIPETKVVLDKEGTVKEIKPYEITVANQMIEEFMLIANMVIAKKFYFLELPFIYRVHEKPDEEKLRQLNEILSSYQKRIKITSHLKAKTLSHILEQMDQEEERKIVSTFMLRSLKIAKYSEVCEEHFGLAAKYYCHFTSPIRRYPDLFIHRVISDYLDSNAMIPDERILEYTNQAAKYAYTSSEAEKNATKIERDFEDLYKVIYMKNFLNEIQVGRISSITSFGMFVTLENTVEGFVGFDCLPGNEYYQYDERKHLLMGTRSANLFKIGDFVKVRVIKCDISLKQIDFKIIE